SKGNSLEDVTSSKLPGTSNPQQTTTKKKPSFKERKEFEDLEKEVAALEAEREELTNHLSNPELGYEQVERISKRLTE
ncbi:ABC transporter C-terminal domain-containing protein, partial [Acinetobacter baumannii]